MSEISKQICEICGVEARIIEPKCIRLWQGKCVLEIKSCKKNCKDFKPSGERKEIYPDLTKPNNFVKFVEIYVNFYSIEMRNRTKNKTFVKFILEEALHKVIHATGIGEWHYEAHELIKAIKEEKWDY